MEPLARLRVNCICPFSGGLTVHPVHALSLVAFRHAEALHLCLSVGYAGPWTVGAAAESVVMGLERSYDEDRAA